MLGQHLTTAHSLATTLTKIFKSLSNSFIHELIVIHDSKFYCIISNLGDIWEELRVSGPLKWFFFAKVNINHSSYFLTVEIAGCRFRHTL